MVFDLYIRVYLRIFLKYFEFINYICYFGVSSSCLYKLNVNKIGS